MNFINAKKFRLKNQAGMTLVEMLIGMIVGVISIMASMSFMNHVFNASNKNALESEKMDLAQQYLAQVDCQATLTKSSCATATSPVPVELYLRRADDTYEKILGKDGTNNWRGNYMVKAMCDPATQSTSIIVARPKSKKPSDAATMFTSSNESNFATDPLTKKPASWTASNSALFKSAVPLCVPTVDVYPDKILCRTFLTSDPSNYTEITYNLLSFYGPNKINGYNRIAMYQGPGGIPGTRISYRQVTGNAVGFTWANCVPISKSADGSVSKSYCLFAKNSTYAFRKQSTTIFACPLKLALDGRETQEIGN